MVLTYGLDGSINLHFQYDTAYNDLLNKHGSDDQNDAGYSLYDRDGDSEQDCSSNSNCNADFNHLRHVELRNDHGRNSDANYHVFSDHGFNSERLTAWEHLGRISGSRFASWCGC